METVDVAIVGAGAAGLAACHSLSGAGWSVTVLEARDRIGGRAWTESIEGRAVDRGAQWLHAAHANPLTAFAHSAGITLTGDAHAAAVIYEGGQPSAPAMARYKRASRTLERRAWFGALIGRQTLAEVAGTGFWTSAVAHAMAQLEMGAAADTVHLPDLLRTERGDDLAVDGGLGGLVEAYGRDVPVRLNHPVAGVDWADRDHVIVQGTFGEIAARRLLVTVSTGVLQSGTIGFDPPLPDWKREAVRGLPMGLLTKVAFILPRPADLPAFAIDLGATRSGPLHLVHLDRSREVATIILGGPPARELMAKGADVAIASGRGILAALVGDPMASGATASISDWDNDPYARGAYAVVAPDVPQARRLYDRPIEQRLFFAGEASRTRQPGTVGGAVLAGCRVARQISATLSAR